MDAFRAFIIRTAEIFILVLVVIFTLMGVFSGWTSGMMTGGAFGALIGLLIGGGIGFVGGCIAAATFFLLLEIARNTRAMLRYYEPQQ